MSRQNTAAAVAACALLMMVPSAVSAGQTSTQVASTPTLAAWSQRVMRDLDRQQKDPIDNRSQVMPTGIAAVKFGCSDSGAPTSVELYKSSGDRRLDRATVRAISKIATLHPLPHGLGHDQQYIVRVLFANSGQSADRLTRKMQEEAAKNNAWYDKRSMLTASIQVVPVG